VILPLFAACLALVFPVLVIVAAVRDATSFTIPNWISLALVAAFPLAALAAGLPPLEIARHAGVGAIALAAGMALFALRWAGGGDAKLLAASALWLGWPDVAQFLAVMALSGGTLAVVLLTLRSAALRPFVMLGPEWVTRLAKPGESIPYGLAIAVGALTVFPDSALMAAFPF
jgi:prepilin peptidase CpaA